MGWMIASPSNPTGTVLSDSELADICRWCDRHGVRLISDEIYHGLVYGKRAETALNYTKNAIVINSMSKYFSMTGWRIGWMVLPDDLVDPVEKLAQIYLFLHQHQTSWQRWRRLTVRRAGKTLSALCQ